MRIKLFEEYSGKLYHEISVDEWNDFMSDDIETDELSGDKVVIPYTRFEDFTIKELGVIQSYFKDWFISGPYGKPLSEFTSGGLIIINVSVTDYDRYGLSLIKLVDEWYYVYDKYSVKYYKCDTFDGMLECLLYCTSSVSFPQYLRNRLGIL